MQSCVRSFLTRKKIKQHYRTLFDKTVSTLKNKQPPEDVLSSLVKNLVFFHNREIDSQRLVRAIYFFFPTKLTQTAYFTVKHECKTFIYALQFYFLS